MAGKDKADSTPGAPHEATWGMTDAAKREWEAKNGDRIRKENKAKEESE